jgi:hypothetical protein
VPLPARVTAPRSVLAEHRAEARRILAECPEWTDGGGAPELSADFERLRWFALGARQLV